MGTNSPNIGLNIPTPNDPAVANVWPSLWNTNAGMIDSSIAGLLPLDVSGSSNVTLTFTNGSPNQTDNAIFVFSGTLTGNIDVLLPNGKSKLFMVKNSTTGAFTLSMGINSTGSPGTPAGGVVVVPQGATGMYYSDGTNVFSAFPTTFVSPTFTGTMTMPDGSTWTSAGIANLVKLGIGMSPFNVLDITQSVNGNAVAQILNPNSGAAAIAVLETSNGTHATTMFTLGENFTPAGFFIPGLGVISSSIGLGIQTGSGPILFSPQGSTERARFGTDGSLLIGSTTNAGAGAIGAAGNITAFYSDERLKDRVGRVTNALEKVMSLSAFYYHANDLAKDLSNGIYDPSIREVGLSAQEVEAVLPEVVAPAPFNHDYKTLRYERIVALLVAAIQEQQAQIEILKAAK